MKKSVVITSCVLVLVVILGFMFFQRNNQTSLTGNVVFSQPVVLNCSDQSMKTLWEAYFKESFEGVNSARDMQGGGNCEYAALKSKGTEKFKLHVTERYISGGMKNITVRGYHGNLSSVGMSGFGLIEEANMLDEEYYQPRQASLTSSVQAEENFENYFKLSSLSFGAEQTNGGDQVFLCDECLGYKASEEGNGESVLAMTMADLSLDYLRHSQNVIQPCTQNWTAKNTTCINDRKITWFNDSNFCENITGIPLNVTSFCDADSNGIIGNASSVGTNNFVNLKIFINNSELNLSTVYSSVKTIEIKDNDTLRVQFDWNFSTPLNLLNQVEIKKSSSGSTSGGYIIVRNLEVNKTVYLDKKGNDTKICIKNSSAVSSTNSFSHYCDDDDETLLTCPETKEGFSCIVENNNTFKVSGLMHSGVLEMINYSTGCVPSWSCSSFGYCVNSVKTRTCTDSNNCNSSSSRPALTQTCNLSEEDSLDNTSVQTNTVLTNTDPIIKTATESSNKINPMIFVYILVGIFIVIVIAAGIFIIQKKKAEKSPSSINDQLKPYLNNSQVPPQNPSNNSGGLPPNDQNKPL